ncbi:MAG TPA: sigma-54 dependent transcriptional regulator [Polyangiaceae bacterium]
MKGDEAAASILVVEDDSSARFGLCGVLRELGYRVLEADSCEAATRLLGARPDVVVTDLRLPDGDALDFLPRLREIDPTVPVFIVTGYGTVDLAVRAIKEGAEDFLMKPVDARALGTFVKRAVAKRNEQRSERRLRAAGGAFVPRSAAMQAIETQIEKLRDADCAVLLLGETGTGKSVLARRIHAVGARSQAPFVDINCAGLTKEFVETELFGHERGAFTGAHAAKAGLLDAANGGTLFLDEIGDIDMQVQPKLLKVLEEKRFRRMGDVRERSVDVRLVAATHHDLLAAIGRKQFRVDLYYRISTVSITMPSLRDRGEDLIPLAYHMLAELGAPEVELALDAKQALHDHPWPGNLRELKNVLERALLLRSGDSVKAPDVRFDTPSGKHLRATPSEDAGARTLSEVERMHIERALMAEQGRVEAAAKRLGMPRSTLYQRIKDYGIRPSKIRLAAMKSDPPDSPPPSSRR